MAATHSQMVRIPSAATTGTMFKLTTATRYSQVRSQTPRALTREAEDGAV